jgi:hypothetical protein
LAELAGWAMRYRSIGPTIEFLTYTVAILGRAGERSGSSLSRLRQARDEVRDRLAGGEIEPGRAARSEPEAEARKRRRARFEARDRAVEGTEATDLADALGGAKRAAAEKDAAPPSRHPEREEDVDAGERASRLREAKKKARKEMEKRRKGD